MIWLMLCLSLVAIIHSIFAMYISLDVRTELRAQQKSTHRIQMVPVDQLNSWTPEDDITKTYNKDNPSVNFEDNL